MKKQLQITKMVRDVSISSPETHPLNVGWKITVRTDMNQGEANAEIYVAWHYETPDDIKQVEPGMYVTILYYANNVIEENGHQFVKADEIFINHEETERKRNQFDFATEEDEETPGTVFKILIESPYQVSG